MTAQKRNFLVLLLVLGLCAGSVAVVLLKPTRLGLDLKGGVELVYQGKPTPQQPEITQEAIDRALEIMRERVDKLGVSEPEIQRSGRDQIAVGLPDVKNAQRAIDQVGTTAQLFFYDWEPNVIGPNGRTDAANPEVTRVPLSYYNAILRASKRAAVKDKDNTSSGPLFFIIRDRDKRVVGGPEDSERDLVSELPGERIPAGSRVVQIQPGTVVLKGPEDEQPKEDARPARCQGKNAPDDCFKWYVLNDDPELRGSDIKNPEQNFDQSSGGQGEPIVTMSFTDKGQKAFQTVTRRIAQRGQQQQVPGTRADSAYQLFAISLDDEVVSRPFIDFVRNPDGIDGKDGAEISGGFEIQEAQDLANFLKIGALPIRLELISQSQVSATLGKQALDQGLVAGIAGFIIVALFLLVFYRVLGLIAVGALLIYVLYLFALIKLIPITLTLPGIAGLILTIGVAADANIVIFERVKEEIRAGRTIQAGIAAGYKRGLTAIIDANAVTLMVAFILFILATAGVKGFAFVLGVGTIVSFLTAVLATQAILGTLGASKLLQSRSALGAGEQKRRFTFDFLGAARWFFSMSGIILLVGALAIGGKGLTFGIDFESGTRIKTALTKPADENSVRTALEGAGFADAKIQKLSEPKLGKNVFQISTPTLQPNQVQDVRALLDERFGVGNTFSNQSIGPTFGETVARSAVIAIIASLLVISLYIALRFEWKYAVPVLIALLHDLLITAGVYSLTDREVTTSTVAALLTILGYSLYDTIIVFDRIRENVPRMPRATYSQIVNRSMSEVITRSLATSFCTLLPVLALMLFGGETLTDFAFALLVGIASGTYSSIFIASPLLVLWKEREPVYQRRADRVKRESGGIVPAYAVATAGIPVEMAPSKRKRRGSSRLTTPEEPGELSKEEFDDLVADLDVDDDAAVSRPAAKPAGIKPSQRPASRSSSTRGATQRAPEPADGGDSGGKGSGTPGKDDADGGSDGPAPQKPKPKPKRPRNRKHGRSR